MSKKPVSRLQNIYDKPWKHLLAAVVGFCLAYAAASWAIETGRLTAYFIAIVLLVLSVRHVAGAITKTHAAKK